MKRPAATLLGLGAAALLWLAPLGAQELPGVTDAEAPAEAEAEQAKLAELRSQIASLEKRAAEWQAKALEYREARENAPRLLAEIKAEIAELQAPPPPLRDGVGTEELEVLVLGIEQDLALAQREAADLEAERGRRGDRRRALPELLSETKGRLGALGEAPAPATPESEPTAEARARVAELQRLVLEQESQAYEQELASFEARGQLLDRRLERAQLRSTRESQRLEALREILTARREGEAEQAAEEAMESVVGAESLAPAVRETVRRLAEENARLAQARTGEDGLLQAIEEVSGKLTRAEARISEVQTDYERLSYKVQTAGLTDSVGLLLRKTRSEVPDVGKFRRFIRMRQEQISAVQERIDELREELNSLANVDAIVANTVARFDAELNEGEAGRLEGLLRDLLETKSKHLKQLLEDYELYFQKLVDFDASQQQLIEKTNDLLLFIDERILWIPSGEAVRWRVVEDGVDALQWLTTPRYWGQLGRSLWTALGEAPLLNLVAFLVLALALPLAQRAKPRLAELAGEAGAPTCTRMAPTFEALGLSLLVAPWAPALLAYLGWRLGVAPDATQFVRSVAHGLLGAGIIWLTFEVPRQLLRRDGLGEAHLSWPRAAVRTLRREIGWIASIAVPLVFVIQLFEMRGEEAWRESAGRLAFLTAMGVVAVVTHWMLREKGALREILVASPWVRIDPWAWRLLYAAAIAVPLGLGVAAARGYYWTALQLASSYHLTLLFLFLLLCVLQLALRWSGLARRRLALRQWSEKREAERQRRDANELTSETTVLPEPELDLEAVDVQTGRLLATTAALLMGIGLWFLWVDLVPAFGILDSVDLWSTSESATIEITSADGTSEFQTEERVVPVTLADLIAALLIAFMTLVLVRNLPGLLEISLFRQLGTAAGERYAYATIAKYAIVLVGGVLAFNAVGVGWGNIQWLVAAVGLGLGFGLQEIFANFVSGLIILFERPIRVGDTVTVGDVSGTVSKIRIRATWITGFDRKELVVPNKEFVTNRLVNWSLTDRILRLTISVGIAYGSDTERAIRELYQVAKANSDVLEDPKPDVIFTGFGDSALNFELRVFSPDPDRRLRMVHELHLGIDRAFREAGIEIAFPQRDLHLRSLPTPEASGDAAAKVAPQAPNDSDE